MYGFEFETKIQNGIIKIPDKYLNIVGDKVKVIILTEVHQKKAVSEFKSVKIRTKGYKFDRESANER